jgi:hypothetical protein
MFIDKCNESFNESTIVFNAIVDSFHYKNAVKSEVDAL